MPTGRRIQESELGYSRDLDRATAGYQDIIKKLTGCERGLSWKERHYVSQHTHTCPPLACPRLRAPCPLLACPCSRVPAFGMNWAGGARITRMHACRVAGPTPIPAGRATIVLHFPDADLPLRRPRQVILPIPEALPGPWLGSATSPTYRPARPCARSA